MSPAASLSLNSCTKVLLRIFQINDRKCYTHLELEQAAPVADGLHVVLVRVAGGEEGVGGDLEVAHPAPALRRALHLRRVIKPSDLDLNIITL